jgi:hypothetical protein
MDRELSDEDFTRAGHEVGLDLIRKVLRDHGSDASVHFGFGLLLSVVRLMWGLALDPKREKVMTNLKRAVDWAEEQETKNPIVETAPRAKPPGGMLH